jgi:hypothetical protein
LQLPFCSALTEKVFGEVGIDAGLAVHSAALLL